MAAILRGAADIRCKRPAVCACFHCPAQRNRKQPSGNNRPAERAEKPPTYGAIMLTAIISPVPRSFPAKTRMKEIRNVTEEFCRPVCLKPSAPEWPYLQHAWKLGATVKGIHRHNANFMISAGWNCVPAITKPSGIAR